jgi:hypothetical protein
MTAARAPDPTKSPVVVEIRAAVARLSPSVLRRLREDLFRLQLRLIGDMVEGGVDIPKVTAISHICRTIEAVDLIGAGAHERQRRG